MIKNKIKKLPDWPGVYLFKGKKGEILYIGKATSIRDRVRSYFSNDLLLTRGPLIEKMISEAENISFKKTDSVLEALILEANLIKKHQPRYNTQEKDDKSWNYVVITKEKFPRVLLVRGKDLNLDPKPYTLMTIFGPYPHGGQLKEALKIIRKIFPFRDQKTKNSYNERFYQELGLAPKTGSKEAEKEYKKTIKHLKLFFEGKKTRLIKTLEKEMEDEAKKRNFEKAGELRNKIFALNHIQDIALLKNENYGSQATNYRLESYDIAHMSGKFVVGGMVVVEDGELNKNEYRKFKIKINPGINDPAALKEIITRRLSHKEWKFPDLISVDGGIIQKRAAENAVKEMKLNIPVVSVVKDERHKSRQILGQKNLIKEYKKELLIANQEAHRFVISYHKKLREKLK